MIDGAVRRLDALGGSSGSSGSVGAGWSSRADTGASGWVIGVNLLLIGRAAQTFYRRLVGLRYDVDHGHF